METIKITPRTLNKLKFNSDGLIPAIVQDYKSKEVLMMAYMNIDSLRQTLKIGKTCFWSRSRKEYWVKGMTSGHFQYVKSVAYDCDCDTLLIKVRQVGAACHTFKKSCFYRKIK
ncbi:MAG: phosphoribosyl-AMP cyclohydrolase [Candidatus Omnitrophica bacterium]|nr:phosphoribosyl-AMP cyclohydrolase [Candidatus Omnitrophota bacterium]